MSEVLEHYHQERNHQGKNNVLLFPAPAPLEPGRRPASTVKNASAAYFGTTAAPHEYFDQTPIDFSEFSARAYHYALSLAEHYQAELVAHHIVELWRYHSLAFAASVGAYDEFCQSVREKGKKQLQEFVKNTAHQGIHPRLLVNDGMAPDSILAFAEAHKPDLIVTGTRAAGLSISGVTICSNLEISPAARTN